MNFDPSKLGQGRGDRPRAPHYSSPRVGPVPEDDPEDARVQQLIAQRQENAQRMQASRCNGCQFAVFYRMTKEGPWTCVCELTSKQMLPIIDCSRYEPVPGKQVS